MMTANHLVSTKDGFKEVGSLKPDDEIITSNGPIKVSSVFKNGASDNQKAEYLGDSVYAKYDGCQIHLTTDNGMGASNLIFLEHDVALKLKDFIEKIFP